MTETVQRLARAVADRYRIDRELGAGGMATVYLAHDLKHDRPVAVKVLRPELAHAVGPDRFLREIEIAARLHHPHILALYDSGEADGLLYYTMPLVEGESLRDRLTREKQLPIDDALAIAREVADALSYAHSRGFIHRDIKPENILLESGHAVVADFGIARAITAAGSDVLTATGLAIGTPMYMSPEQAGGTADVDARSDVYSLACVLFEMLAGEPPYTGPSAQAIIAKSLSEPVPSLAVVRETVPEALERTVTRALAKTPADRFATAADFANALTAEGGPQWGPRSAGASRFAGRRVLLAGATALAALGLGVTGFVLLGGERNPGRAESAAEPAIAVLPFQTVGPDLEFWREGMVHMLSFNLEGITGLRKVDPATVMNAWSRRSGDEERVPDREGALAVAGQVGARYAVTGSVVPLQDGLRLTAEVHEVERGRSRGSVAIDGPADSVSALVDRLTLELLRQNVVPADSVPPVNLSRVTTASLPALKAYLAGEQKYRRAQFREAALEYERAIELDSTFARAIYRAARSYFWTGPMTLANEYAERATHLADRLPERDAMLLRGAFSHGREGVSSLERLTSQYPDDAEGWVALGDAYFHSGGVNVRPTSAFRNAFESAMELSPYYGEAYVHLIEDAFARIDSARARELVSAYRAIDSGSEPCGYPYMSYDLVFGSDAARAEAVVALDTVSARGSVLGCVQSALAAPAEVLDKMAQLYRTTVFSHPRPLYRVASLWRLLQVHVPRGRIVAAREVLDRVEAVPSIRAYGAFWEIMLHLSGFPDTASARGAAGVLAQAPDATDHFWLGALALAEERWDDAEQVSVLLENEALGMKSLTSSWDSAEVAGHARAYAEGLRAYGAMLRGDRTRLPAFEDALLRFPPASYHHEQPQQYLRYAVGQLLIEWGELRRAERYFSSFTPYDYYYTAPAEFYLGQIYEGLGQPDDAVVHYDRFVTWWRDADPELRPWWEQAREALQRLTQESDAPAGRR